MIQPQVTEQDQRIAQILEKFPTLRLRTVRRNTPVLEVPPDKLVEVARWLKEEGSLAFNYLVSITAVDYWEYFEVAYLLHSIPYGHSVELKVNVDRERPVVPSLTSIWRGADVQEREVYDLMGVEFSGHPELKRILLWDSFEGHPLRKDFDKQPDDIPIPEE